MYSDAFAAGDVPNDSFPADGVTTTCAINEEIAVAFDANSVVFISAENPPHDAGKSTRFFDLFFRRRFRSVGGQLRQHLACSEFAVADSGHEVINLAQAIVGSCSLQVFVFDVFEGDAILASFLFNQLAADFDGALPLMNVQPMLDFVSRARRLNYAQPVAAWRVSRLSENFDDVSAMQFMAQRHHASVDFGADARMTNLGMNGIGKINRRRISRQNDYFALRRKGIDLFRIKINFQRRKKFVGIGDI